MNNSGGNTEKGLKPSLKEGLVDQLESGLGHLHPVTQVINSAISIFDKLGFVVAEGPEIESEYYNFDALNVAPNHPARDMWDTFWLKQPQGLFARPDSLESGVGLKPDNSRKLLRTHTSPVQIRYMEQNKPPLKIIAPGKTFRYEATDATHEAQFYQLEGLVIGKDVNMSDMKGTLEYFFTQFFNKKTDIRLRPSFFPFVEPGVEIDMSCFRCDGKGLKTSSKEGLVDQGEAGLGCNVCKGTGFIEIMGAGMVHPVVLNNVGINPKEWQGFAFGVGVDRLAMLKYGIDDVRLLYQGDLRLTNQF